MSIRETTRDFQFSNCSYAELTFCVQSRVKNIREKRKAMELLREHGYKMAALSLKFSKMTEEDEINYLLERRREMKRDSHEASAFLRQSLTARD